MLINIKTDKNFTTAYNKLVDKYGEKFQILNGFHDSQMNYSDFIDSFIDNNVADVTIDANANVGTKDIRSLLSEKGKSHDKLFAANKIFYEIKKKYGLNTAREWLETEYNGGFYLHDFPSTTYYSYSYKGTETIVVKYNGKILLTSFEMLFDIVEEPIQLLNEKDSAYCKYTNDLFVWDRDNKWTKVIRVIRKPKTKDFHFIKSSNGMSEIVTSNHPIITTEGDIDAEKVTTEHKIISQQYLMSNIGNIDEIFCTDELSKYDDKEIYFKGEKFSEYTGNDKDGQVCYYKGTNPIQNRIKLDFDFGWLVGMFIAEGHARNDCIVISQNKGDIYDNILRILEEKNYGYSIYKKENSDCYNVYVRSQVLRDIILNVFCTGDLSYNKKLNPNILNYNKDFLKGIIGGILDGDGSLTQAQGRRIHIRMSSRTLINQIAFIIRMFGYTVREQTPAIYKSNDDKIVQRNYIYHIAFTPYCDVENFDSIKIRNHNVKFTSKEEEGRYTNGKYTFGYGNHQVTNNEVLSLDKDEYVYDISVETGHFMCNNILSHNCYAYDLTRLATEGLFFLKNYNAEPPKHLTTYFDDVIEFISYMTNRSSGACGLPNVLIWSYYFWKKDCEGGYYIKDKDYYLRQNFQKFIYRLNQPFMRIDQTAFTNVSIFDREYLASLFGGVEYPDGSLVIDNIEEIIEHQKIFMEVVSEIRSQNLFTYPVLTYSLLYQNNKFVDEDFARWCSNHNRLWNDANFFVSGDVGTLSNCCRLLSSTKKLDAFINSIGGTALSIGSVKVNTINLMRIAYESEGDINKYLEILKEKSILCCKVLDTVRHIIKRNIEKGLLPNYQDGGIELEKQYNTMGILGLYEAIEYFGFIDEDEFGNKYYSDSGIDFASKIFEVLNDVKDNFTDEYSINIESVPRASGNKVA